MFQKDLLHKKKENNLYNLCSKLIGKGKQNVILNNKENTIKVTSQIDLNGLENMIIFFGDCSSLIIQAKQGNIENIFIQSGAAKFIANENDIEQMINALAPVKKSVLAFFSGGHNNLGKNNKTLQCFISEISQPNQQHIRDNIVDFCQQ